MQRPLLIIGTGLAITLGTSAFAAEWTFGPSLNVPRASPGAAVDERGNIYLLGGKISWASPPYFTETVEMLAFDGQQYADKWVKIAPMSSPRRGMAAICANGFLYSIGGNDDAGVVFKIVERLDLTKPGEGWEVIEPLKTARSSAGVTLDKRGCIWIIGGSTNPDENGQNWLNSAELYDPARPRTGWELLDDQLQDDRVNNGAATDALGRIYTFGGTQYSQGGQHLATVERFDPCNSNAGWVKVASQIGPNSNDDQAVVGADGRIYVAGGWLPGVSNLVQRYDPINDSWEDWLPMNVARSELRLVLGADGRVFAIGGAGLGGTNALDTVELLTAPCGASQARPNLMDSDANGAIDVDDLIGVINKWGGCE